MVKLERRERLRHFGAAGDDRNFILREVFADQFSHQVGCLLGEFRRLDHRPVARSQNLHQRIERQLDGEIPWAEDADHALGLEPQFSLGPQQSERECGLALFRLGPFVEMLEAIFAEIDAADDVGHHRLVAAAIAEILVHRLAQIFAVIDEQSNRPLDPVLALVQPLGPRGGERITLSFEDCIQFVFAITGHIITLHWYLFATDCSPALPE